MLSTCLKIIIIIIIIIIVFLLLYHHIYWNDLTSDIEAITFCLNQILISQIMLNDSFKANVH